MSGTDKISAQTLSQYFHLPEKEAARLLGVCLTSLKKLCRRHRLFRWPYRKFRSIQYKIDKIDEAEDPRGADKIAALKKEKREFVSTFCAKLSKTSQSHIDDSFSSDGEDIIASSSPAQPKPVRKSARRTQMKTRFEEFTSSDEEFEALIEEAEASTSSTTPRKSASTAQQKRSSPSAARTQSKRRRTSKKEEEEYEEIVSDLEEIASVDEADSDDEAVSDVKLAALEPESFPSPAAPFTSEVEHVDSPNTPSSFTSIITADCTANLDFPEPHLELEFIEKQEEIMEPVNQKPPVSITAPQFINVEPSQFSHILPTYLSRTSYDESFNFPSSIDFASLQQSPMLTKSLTPVTRTKDPMLYDAIPPIWEFPVM